MPKIFVSYRRSDAEDAAGRLYDHLHSRFGPQAIFMDVDSIPVGVNFRAHLQQAVVRSDVLLVLIGESWLHVSYHDGPHRGQRRIEDPDDFVRIEVEAALSSGIPVIPLLIGRATMPHADDLPENMKELAYQQGAELRAGRDYQGHIQRLIRDLTRMFDPDHSEQTPHSHSVSAITRTDSVAKTPPQAEYNPIGQWSLPANPEVATLISSALRDIDAHEHGDMGSFYILDNNSRRIFGRLKTQLASASLDEIQQAILLHLGSSDSMERWKAMRLLVWWKLATPQIIRRFWEKEPKWICRQIVIEAAQSLPEQDRLDLLADVALLDDNGRNRNAALPHLTALAQGLNKGRVINVLMELLETDDPWGTLGARSEALKQLRTLKVPEVVEKARELLRNDKDYSVRNEAAAFISEQGDLDTLLDVGEALSRQHVNEHVFKECLGRYLQRFNLRALLAVISAIASGTSRQIAQTMLSEISNPSPMPAYFCRLSGKVIYADGSEQTFSGFRCFCSTDRVYYSQHIESLTPSTYRSSSSIDLKQVAAINFDERPNDNLRRGTVQFTNGKVLENMYFYVSECSWWESPGLQGKLNDPLIRTLVMVNTPQPIPAS